MGDNDTGPIVSSVVITEVKDETPDSVIDNKLADYYKTLRSTTMKPLSFDIDDEETDPAVTSSSPPTTSTTSTPKIAVATAEIKHQASSSNQFRVMSRFRSESRSSSTYQSSTTSSSSTSGSGISVGGPMSNTNISGIGSILSPNLKLERINEAREMQVTQQVTSPIHLKVITSRNRIHMQHVRSISEYRSKM